MYTPKKLVLTLFLSAIGVFSFDKNFESWDALLKTHVVPTAGGETTKVNYTELKKNKDKLSPVLKSMSEVSRADFNSWSKSEQLAFLINAYNAFTWKLMADNWPLKSIKDIGSPLKSPWKKEFFNLFGKQRSLDWLEHDMIRKNYSEPRVHFALNCASIGCPPLRTEAYTAGKLEDQLEAQTKLFLGNAGENSIDVNKRELELSEIFSWFNKDFTQKTPSLLHWLKAYFPAINPEEKWNISYKNYNWKANGY